jgi:hypothetical protein
VHRVRLSHLGWHLQHLPHEGAGRRRRLAPPSPHHHRAAQDDLRGVFLRNTPGTAAVDFAAFFRAPPCSGGKYAVHLQENATHVGIAPMAGHTA